VARVNWDLARRRDPHPDPNERLRTDQARMATIERLRDRPMSVTIRDLSNDPGAARAEADAIQRRLKDDLERCRWASEALTERERRAFVRRAEREHSRISTWLSILTGEAFSVRPPGRHRIGESG
jgi:hypothetical protein